MITNPFQVIDDYVVVEASCHGCNHLIYITESDFKLLDGKISIVDKGSGGMQVKLRNGKKQLSLYKVIYGKNCTCKNFIDRTKFDFRRENYSKTVKSPCERRPEDTWDLSEEGITWLTISLCIDENPNATIDELIKNISLTKGVPLTETRERILPLYERGQLRRMNRGSREWEKWVPHEISC